MLSGNPEDARQDTIARDRKSTNLHYWSSRIPVCVLGHVGAPNCVLFVQAALWQESDG